MSEYKPKFMILSGEGINCENESSLAITICGGEATIVHINQLMDEPALLHEYDGLFIPGGFSFGDELGSGQLMALKIKHKLGAELNQFIQAQKPILGVCNGFQILVRLGILPGKTDGPEFALVSNENGSFLNRWVKLRVNSNNKSPWLRGITELELPVRHGEGRLIARADLNLDEYKDNGLLPISYVENINGSIENLAGLTNETGLVLGLMPHPEAAIFQATNYEKSDSPIEKDQGAQLFQNIITYIREQKNEISN